MKVPGLELADVLGVHPLPWTPDVVCRSIRDANGVVVPISVSRSLRVVCEAAPELASALVSVTQALVDGLEVHAPGIDPLQHAAVQQALAALAKARGEA